VWFLLSEVTNSAYLERQPEEEEEEEEDEEEENKKCG